MLFRSSTTFGRSATVLRLALVLVAFSSPRCLETEIVALPPNVGQPVGVMLREMPATDDAASLTAHTAGDEINSLRSVYSPALPLVYGHKSGAH